MVATLSPGARIACRVAGIALVAVGIVLLINAVLAMTNGPSAGGDFYSFQRDSERSVRSFALSGFGGMACLGLGAFLVRLGFLSVAAGIVATETAPAVEHSAGAVGRGLRSAGFAMGQATVVKVKCRKCGFLESEDARFCSSCGKAV